jgi:hypothetical protein
MKHSFPENEIGYAEPVICVGYETRGDVGELEYEWVCPPEGVLEQLFGLFTVRFPALIP